MAYRKRRVKSKNIIETTCYHSQRYQSKKKSRAKNSNTTPAAQQKANQRRSAEKLRLLLDVNFATDDLYITLTYDTKNPPTEPEAKKAYNRFMRKLRDIYEKHDVKLKSISITEEGERRIHHHVLINRIPAVGRGEIERLWGTGFVKVQLFGGMPQDCIRVADYFTKLTQKMKRRGVCRGWNPSKGLIHPEPPEVKNVPADTWMETPKPIKGYYVEEVERGYTKMGYPYLFYRMIKLPDYQIEKRME